MYIKVFENRKTSRCYLIKHDISIKGLDHGVLYIHDQDNHSVRVCESAVFQAIDKLFKEKLK